jgi:hypothetical protein
MKKKAQNPGIPTIVRRVAPWLIVLGLLPPWRDAVAGYWTSVIQPAPDRIQLILLLSDGTVMANQVDDLSPPANTNWYRLKPDGYGSYVNGRWTKLKPMNNPRQFYSSTVLRDGRVLVAGGEYGTGSNTAEVYDPGSDNWTPAPVPLALLDPSTDNILDAPGVILPDGKVLVAPVYPRNRSGYPRTGTLIYDPALNTWSDGSNSIRWQAEATWVKLPDGSILSADPTSDGQAKNSERYIPSLNTWIDDGLIPVSLFNASTCCVGEIGGALLLHDGRAFFMGGLGHTAFYTPTGNLNNGTWTAGPDLPSPTVGWDNPVAMLVTGKILLPAVHSSNPTTFSYLEFDPKANPMTTANAFSPAGDYWGDSSGDSHVMLNLPDGSVLMSYGNATLRIYVPDGLPDASGKPTISSVTLNADGSSYHLIGTKLNGISQGSSFGDDAQMDSNYPIVRLTDGAGNVYYARTYNWSSTGVQTGNTPVSTEFTLPQEVHTPGNYSLVVVANGIASNPVFFSGPVWVAFGGSDPGIGTYDRPFNTLARARDAVSSGGTVFIKGPGSTAETITISKGMKIQAVGGRVTIGRL